MSARCYGNEYRGIKHTAKCRPGRPYCRWRRAERWGICSCLAYHFPHRHGSGLCKTGCWAELDRPMRKGA
jgi:hypothetical protein